MNFSFGAIGVWPGKMTSSRRRGQFKSSYEATLRLLDHELVQLTAKDIVLQIAVSPSEIRLDGKPRGGANPAHPGVILSFDSRHGPLSYPCDTFDNWRDNLRAIALSLEHLRAVDRYGVTRSGEQYRGWAALPAPPPAMSKAEATKFLENFTTGEVKNTDQARSAYRAAVMKLHPDRGGDRKEFDRLQLAKEVFGL